MTDQPKYYTPELTDIVHDLEYQWKDPFEDGPWEPGTVNLAYEHEFECDNRSYTFSGIIEEKSLRIKRLDRQDIEDCGFADCGPRVFNKGEYLFLDHTNFDEDKYEIRNNHPSVHYGNFNGVIKNKSELKQIMKMLGII